jgi:hypothetical protein
MSEQQVDLFGEPVVQDAILRDKFMEPPFSVLDSKGGAWQNRKRQWKGVGIESHIGRGDKLLGGGAGNSKEQDEDFSRRMAARYRMVLVYLIVRQVYLTRHYVSWFIGGTARLVARC